MQLQPARVTFVAKTSGRHSERSEESLWRNFIRNASEIAVRMATAVACEGRAAFMVRLARLQLLVGHLRRRDRDGLLVRNRKPVSFKADYFPRMISEHPQAGQAQVDQDLCADAAFMLQ